MQRSAKKREEVKYWQCGMAWGRLAGAALGYMYAAVCGRSNGKRQTANGKEQRANRANSQDSQRKVTRE